MNQLLRKVTLSKDTVPSMAEIELSNLLLDRQMIADAFVYLSNLVS